MDRGAWPFFVMESRVWLFPFLCVKRREKREERGWKRKEERSKGSSEKKRHRDETRWKKRHFFKCFKTLKPARWISPKCFEKITFGWIIPLFFCKPNSTQPEQLRERVSCALSNRASAGLQPGGRSGNTTMQSRRVHDRGKPSRAKPDERCRTPFAVQTFEAKTPTTRQFQRRAKVDHTWHGGIHDDADDKVANRALGSLTFTHSAWRGRSLPQSGPGVSQTTRSTWESVRRFSEA